MHHHRIGAMMTHRVPAPRRSTTGCRGRAANPSQLFRSKLQTTLPLCLSHSPSPSLVSISIELSIYLTFVIVPGTEFNVVGNDWHDGIVTFTLDGVPSAPYDLGSAINSTAVRCRFPWITRTGLAAAQHTFTFNLTAPSDQVLTDTGYVPGYSVYYGVQFFYFS